MTNRVKDIIDAIATGKLADANKAFGDEMEDLVASRLADKKVEVASSISLDDEIEHPEHPEDIEVQDETRQEGEVDVEEYTSEEE